MVLIGVFIVVRVLAGSLGVFSWGLAAVAAGCAYWFDVRWRPRVPCRPCHGTGGNSSFLSGGKYLRRPFGDCWCCGGKKAHPRLALRVMYPARHRDIRSEIAKGRAER